MGRIRLSERDQAIFAAVQAGRKMADVGREHGLSGSRVSEIVRGVQQDLLRPRSVLDDLSVRPHNCLINLFAAEGGKGELSLEWIADHSVSDFLSMENIGKKSVKEIQNLLLKHGLSLKSSGQLKPPSRMVMQFVVTEEDGGHARFSGLEPGTYEIRKVCD